jgi:hypothetical protein
LSERIQIIKLHRPKKKIDPRDNTAYVIQTKEGEGKIAECGSNNDKEERKA